MKLYSSNTSPYVRKVRVVARECGIDKQIEEIITDPWSNEDLRKLNPLRKVPTLQLDDGSVLFDSRVIADYLADTANSKIFPGRSVWGPVKGRWRAHGLHALGDGIMDAAVNSVVEKRNPPEQWNQGNLTRFRMAIDASLNALEKSVPKFAAEPTIGEIAVGVALGYLDFRFTDLDWRSGHPTLAAWYATFSQRPSMLATAPKSAT